MSFSTVEQVDDNIYVNVVISPFLMNSGVFEIAAEYQVTKTIPILSKCNDYYCSIVNFRIPLNDIPLFIMPIVPNQPNSNLTTFKIGITTGGIDYSQSVIYVSETGAPVPLQNQPTQVITLYYYVFSYQNLITAVNTALAAAFLASGLTGNN